MGPRWDRDLDRTGTLQTGMEPERDETGNGSETGTVAGPGSGQKSKRYRMWDGTWTRPWTDTVLGRDRDGNKTKIGLGPGGERYQNRDRDGTGKGPGRDR